MALRTFAYFVAALPPLAGKGDVTVDLYLLRDRKFCRIANNPSGTENCRLGGNHEVHFA